MSWIQLHIYTDGKSADIITRELETNGALAVTTRSNQGTPYYESGPGHFVPWQHICVTGLFPEEAEVKPILSQIKKRLPQNSIQDFQIEALDDRDWERVCLESFQPIEVGSNLWVCPSWCTPPPSPATVITLDPGLAFGTGTHATTRLCLKWLAEADLIGRRILDYGCGSGILAIGALKLGAQQAWGVDIDPRALTTSLENSKVNNTNANIKLGQPDALPTDMKFDVVIANILANTLLTLQPLLSDKVAVDGYLLLSGILENQFNAILKVYGEEFGFEKCQQEEWILLVGRKQD